MDAAAEKDSGESSAEKSASKHGSRRGALKVWRTMRALTRRAARRSSLPADAVFSELSPRSLSPAPAPSRRLLAWSESSSPSDDDDDDDDFRRRGAVVGQNCVRLSVARARFHDGGQRRAWLAGKQACPDGEDGGMAHRTASVPSVVSAGKPCHCSACCSCTRRRQRGVRPAMQRAGSCDSALRRRSGVVPRGTGRRRASDVRDDATPSSSSDGRCSGLPKHYRRAGGRRDTQPLDSDVGSIDDVDGQALCGTAARWRDDEVTPSEFKAKLNTMKRWFADFNDEQKNLLLTELLRDCAVPQTHLLSVELAPRLHHGCPPNCCDRLSWLPASLSLHILSQLDAVSLCRASGVSSAWHQLASEPRLWKRLCGHSKWKLSCGGEQKQLIQHMTPNGAINWKKVFSERFRLRNNWLMGKCNVRTFEGHTQGISCVQFDDTRIVSGSSDKTIKVWNIRTNSPWSVQTLVGHSGTVRCLFLDSNRLVSGSTDMTIKVWDLSTQQSWSSIACKVTMTGHLDTVRCLQVDKDKVISGSYDKTLKVWNIRTGACLRTLRGHTAAVLCLQFDNAKIVSGSCDKTIKLWTVEGECLRTLHGHQDAVTCLQFDAMRIVSGSLDCTIRFWAIQTGDCANTIDWKASEGHTGVVRCLQSDSWRVVSASDDRTIKVWSLESGKRLVTLWNHTDGVTCLQFNDSIIVSGSYDQTVKLWDFSC